MHYAQEWPGGDFLCDAVVATVADFHPTSGFVEIPPSTNALQIDRTGWRRVAVTAVAELEIRMVTQEWKFQGIR